MKPLLCSIGLHGWEPVWRRLNQHGRVIGSLDRCKRCPAERYRGPR